MNLTLSLSVIGMCLNICINDIYIFIFNNFFFTLTLWAIECWQKRGKYTTAAASWNTTYQSVWLLSLVWLYASVWYDESVNNALGFNSVLTSAWQPHPWCYMVTWRHLNACGSPANIHLSYSACFISQSIVQVICWSLLCWAVCVCVSVTLSACVATLSFFFFHCTEEVWCHKHSMYYVLYVCWFFSECMQIYDNVGAQAMAVCSNHNSWLSSH